MCKLSPSTCGTVARSSSEGAVHWLSCLSLPASALEDLMLNTLCVMTVTTYLTGFRLCSLSCKVIVSPWVTTVTLCTATFPEVWPPAFHFSRQLLKCIAIKLPTLEGWKQLWDEKNPFMNFFFDLHLIKWQGWDSTENGGEVKKKISNKRFSSLNSPCVYSQALVHFKFQPSC